MNSLFFLRRTGRAKCVTKFSSKGFNFVQVNTNLYDDHLLYPRCLFNTRSSSREIPKSVMSDCVVELPQEVSVKASQRFEDLELARRSQAGDTEAFGELVTKYRAKIFTMVYCMVCNENDAWDLAQEGFLKAWRLIQQFQGRSSFYTWLYSLTVNLTIDSLRRKGRRVEVELDDAIPSSLPSPRANYHRNEIRQHINAALAQLSPEHRAVIVLKEIEDLQYQEIAKILNLSIGTVMSRLFYGRKQLQSILRPIFNQRYQSQRPPPVRSI
jgi:RNA polymerase sigma-70 factor, ECF subfamily